MATGGHDDALAAPERYSWARFGTLVTSAPPASPQLRGGVHTGQMCERQRCWRVYLAAAYVLLCAGCSHNTTRTCISRSAGKNGSVDACSYIGTWPQNTPSSSLQADPGGDHGRLSYAWKGCSWAAMGLRSFPAPVASRVHSLAMLSLRSVTLLWDLLALIFVRIDDLPQGSRGVKVMEVMLRSHHGIKQSRLLEL